MMMMCPQSCLPLGFLRVVYFSWLMRIPPSLAFGNNRSRRGCSRLPLSSSPCSLAGSRSSLSPCSRGSRSTLLPCRVHRVPGHHCLVLVCTGFQVLITVALLTGGFQLLTTIGFLVTVARFLEFFKVIGTVALFMGFFQVITTTVGFVSCLLLHGSCTRSLEPSSSLLASPAALASPLVVLMIVNSTPL